MASQMPMLKSANDSNKEFADEETQNKIFIQLKNDFQCAICLNLICKATTINCSHIYCYVCITTWKENGNDHCPICRTIIDSYSNCNILDKHITNVCDLMGGQIKKERHLLLSERSKGTIYSGLRVSKRTGGIDRSSGKNFRRYSSSASSEFSTHYNANGIFFPRLFFQRSDRHN